VADSTVVPLYNPGLPYQRGKISRNGDRTDWFGVNAMALREILAVHGSPAADAQQRLFEHDYSRSTPAIFLAQRRVFEHVVSSPAPDPLRVEESVLTILDGVLSGLDSSRARPAPLSHAQRQVAEHLRAHLNVSFDGSEDLTALAGTVGASVFHLCRVFKRHTGQTIHGYRNQLRLRRALDLLRDTDDSLSIAMALGYSGHSHFTAAFHRVFGMTPSRYRALSRSRRAAVAERLHLGQPREQSAVNRPQPH
jgi:AraC family transcriptional regulator